MLVVNRTGGYTVLELRREVLPIVRVGIAVLRHPRRPGEEDVIPPHVEEGNGAVHRPEQVRPHGVHVPHQEPAQPHSDESLRHGGEVLVRSVAVGLEGGLMPTVGLHYSGILNAGYRRPSPCKNGGRGSGGKQEQSKNDKNEGRTIYFGPNISIFLNGYGIVLVERGLLVVVVVVEGKFRER